MEAHHREAALTHTTALLQQMTEMKGQFEAKTEALSKQNDELRKDLEAMRAQRDEERKAHRDDIERVERKLTAVERKAGAADEKARDLEKAAAWFEHCFKNVSKLGRGGLCAVKSATFSRLGRQFHLELRRLGGKDTSPFQLWLRSSTEHEGGYLKCDTTFQYTLAVSHWLLPQALRSTTQNAIFCGRDSGNHGWCFELGTLKRLEEEGAYFALRDQLTVGVEILPRPDHAADEPAETRQLLYARVALLVCVDWCVLQSVALGLLC